MGSPILVTGATGGHGSTGRHVVLRLIEAGETVRALVRRRDERTKPLEALGVEIVVGDLTDRLSLLPAFEGVERATFTYPIASGVVEAAAAFSAAARESSKPPRIVVMSMAPAHPQSPSHLGRAQWLAEEVMAWAGLEILVLRIAALFFENLPMLHGRSIVEDGLIRNNFGDTRLPWISGADAGDLVVAALLHPDRFGGNAVQYPPGVELLSHAEIARILSQSLGRPIGYEAISAEAWRDDLIASAKANPGGAINVDMARHISAVAAALATPGAAPARLPEPAELQRLTGHSPVYFGDFITGPNAPFKGRSA